ncbi:MAG: hypothetical protein ACK5XF_05305 [Neisseriaceae bacterium]
MLFIQLLLLTSCGSGGSSNSSTSNNVPPPPKGLAELIVEIPTKDQLSMPNLPDTIGVQLYKSESLIGTYQVSLVNKTTRLGNYNPGTYTLVFPTLASAKNGIYLDGDNLVIELRSDRINTIDYVYSQSTIQTKPFIFHVSGLNDVKAVFKYADNLKTVYSTESYINNGDYQVRFPVDVSLYPYVSAAGYISNVNNGITVYNTANTSSANITFISDSNGGTVAGWPSYIAMGAIGGPNITPPTRNSTGGDDDFGGKPIDAVFKYAGVNGNGDPGVIDPPMNVIRMTNDMNMISALNNHPTKVVMVEYTAEMSGGENIADFTNSSIPNPNKQDATYIMARHFATLAADAIAMFNHPVAYNNQNYYGALIMDPDLLGAIQQNNYIGHVNNTLDQTSVNEAVDQILCLMTNSRSYTNHAAPNGRNGQNYIDKTYTGTPVGILQDMLNDGYPAWSISSANDEYWGTSIDNMIQGTESYSQIGKWFNGCITNPTYDKDKYKRPNFSAGFEGWVEANNWIIRTFAPYGTVTFGWQENIWAVNSGFWLHNNLSLDQIASEYSTPVTNWLQTNAKSVITTGALGGSYKPDFFVFDRYETDDSSSPGQATLYSARSWDNYIYAVGLISKAFNNIPIMLWQIPGSHLPYIGESQPQLYNNLPGSYIFSTAPVYFFGDNNLTSDLSNLIVGDSTTNTNVGVGNYIVSSSYNCPFINCNYKQYLGYYNSESNNYDWSKDNNRLGFAAENNIFAILWGGGNTTNVIKNFSNQSDHGYLANKLIKYYQNPAPVIKH